MREGPIKVRHLYEKADEQLYQETQTSLISNVSFFIGHVLAPYILPKMHWGQGQRTRLKTSSSMS